MSVLQPYNNRTVAIPRRTSLNWAKRAPGRPPCCGGLAAIRVVCVRRAASDIDSTASYTMSRMPRATKEEYPEVLRMTVLAVLVGSVVLGCWVAANRMTTQGLGSSRAAGYVAELRLRTSNVTSAKRCGIQLCRAIHVLVVAIYLPHTQPLGVRSILLSQRLRIIT